MKGGQPVRTLSANVLKTGNTIDEDNQRLIQGIIPEMVIDARGRIVELIRAARVSVKGGHTGTCNIGYEGGGAHPENRGL